MWIQTLAFMGLRRPYLLQSKRIISKCILFVCLFVCLLRLGKLCFCFFLWGGGGLMIIRIPIRIYPGSCWYFCRQKPVYKNNFFHCCPYLWSPTSGVGVSKWHPAGKETCQTRTTFKKTQKQAIFFGSIQASRSLLLRFLWSLPTEFGLKSPKPEVLKYVFLCILLRCSFGRRIKKRLASHLSCCIFVANL